MLQVSTCVMKRHVHNILVCARGLSSSECGIFGLRLAAGRRSVTKIFGALLTFKNQFANSRILFTKPYALAHGLSQTLCMSAPSENPSPTTQAGHTNDPTAAAQNEPALSTTNDDSDHLAIVKSLLQDPLLKDLPANPTLEEVKTLIAIEEGRAYRIRIERKGLQDIREFGFIKL